MRSNFKNLTVLDKFWKRWGYLTKFQKLMDLKKWTQTTHNSQDTKNTHTYNVFWRPEGCYQVRVPTEREGSCRWRFADWQRCSSQALRSRESIVERTDGSSGRRKIMIKACGIDVQGTFPRACHIVLPYETYGWLLSVISAGERCMYV